MAKEQPFRPIVALELDLPRLSAAHWSELGHPPFMDWNY
jgi:hypothetical protein